MLTNCISCYNSSRQIWFKTLWSAPRTPSSPCQRLKGSQAFFAVYITTKSFSYYCCCYCCCCCCYSHKTYFHFIFLLKVCSPVSVFLFFSKRISLHTSQPASQPAGRPTDRPTEELARTKYKLQNLLPLVKNGVKLCAWKYWRHACECWAEQSWANERVSLT